MTTTLAEVRAGIVARDQQDMQRDIAPLKQAEDAHLVDATELSLAEVVEECHRLALSVFPRANSLSYEDAGESSKL